ncbi:ATP-dependent endonuclease [Terasakiella sp. SH-1]|uniref:ATP-dependent endonuclease n=1 Tax=Terasakiella sp. SH-1 TaxID=2560057 RepID=UPI0010730C19|nr:ATP-dependent endonuclease [Terasakiella sp. SH-1]
MQIDANVSEMFFGSFPILVEGDTEHAAFLAAVIEVDHQLAQQATIVKARGKALLAPLARILRHFKVPFGIMHDADTPYNKNGGRNGVWTENEKIRLEVEAARSEGLTVNHHVSFPDFERWLEILAVSKDKPLNTYGSVSNNLPLITKGQELFNLLCSGVNSDPISQEVLLEHDNDYMSALLQISREEAQRIGEGNAIQYLGLPETD